MTDLERAALDRLLDYVEGRGVLRRECEMLRARLKRDPAVPVESPWQQYRRIAAECEAHNKLASYEGDGELLARWAQ